MIEIMYILIFFIQDKCFQRNGKNMGKTKEKGSRCPLNSALSVIFKYSNYQIAPHQETKLELDYIIKLNYA